MTRSLHIATDCCCTVGPSCRLTGSKVGQGKGCWPPGIGGNYFGRLYPWCVGLLAAGNPGRKWPLEASKKFLATGSECPGAAGSYCSSFGSREEGGKTGT